MDEDIYIGRLYSSRSGSFSLEYQRDMLFEIGEISSPRLWVWIFLIHLQGTKRKYFISAKSTLKDKMKMKMNWTEKPPLFKRQFFFERPDKNCLLKCDFRDKEVENEEIWDETKKIDVWPLLLKERKTRPICHDI